MASRIRAYTLARELGIDPSEIVDRAASVGIELKSHTVSLDEATALVLRQKLTGPFGDGLSLVVAPAKEKSTKSPDSLIGEFFRVIDRRESKVGQAFRKDVWPVFRALVKQLEADGQLPYDEEETSFQLAEVLCLAGSTPSMHVHFLKWFHERLSEPDSIVHGVNTALETWMEKFHLKTPWAESVALRTLCEWQVTPERDRWFTPEVAAVGGYFNQRDEIRLRLPVLKDLTRATADDWKHKILGTVENLIDQALAYAANQAKQLGVPLAAPGGLGKHTKSHVEWLVRHQVGEEPIARIARRASADPQTVKQAVQSLRKHLGLPKPPARPPGRPKGSKTRSVRN